MLLLILLLWTRHISYGPPQPATGMGFGPKNPCRWLARTGHPGVGHVRIVIGVQLDIWLSLQWSFPMPWRSVFRPVYLLRIFPNQIFLQVCYFV